MAYVGSGAHGTCWDIHDTINDLVDVRSLREEFQNMMRDLWLLAPPILRS